MREKRNHFQGRTKTQQRIVVAFAVHLARIEGCGVFTLIHQSSNEFDQKSPPPLQKNPGKLSQAALGHFSIGAKTEWATYMHKKPFINNKGSGEGSENGQNC